MRVKEWKKFQHFKDRRPPWIKLYRELLDDDEFFMLPPQSAKTLVLIWLLASEDKNGNGELPSLKKMAFRLRIQEKSLKSIISGLSHWLIQDDIKTISPRYQDGSSETETETETERERESDIATRPTRSTLSDAEWIEGLKSNPAYQHVDFVSENGKMDAWLALPKNRNRIKTRRFILNWLNKIEKPASTGNGIVSHAPIPPFPGPEDPIARGQWRKLYGDPANPQRRA